MRKNTKMAAQKQGRAGAGHDERFQKAAGLRVFATLPERFSALERKDDKLT